MKRSLLATWLGALVIAVGATAAALLVGARLSGAADLRNWCAVLAGAYLLCLAGIVPAWLLTSGRLVADRLRATPGAPGATAAPATDPETQLREDAAWPQLLAVALPVAVALVALVRMPPQPGTSAAALLAAIISFALIFPTVLVERLLAEVGETLLPERAGLLRLLRIPTACAALCGLSLLATSMGWGSAWLLQYPAYALVGLVALELGLRALVHGVLGPQRLVSCADSLVAGAVLTRRNPLTALHAGLRDRFGIDLTQSWSARLVGAASPWVLVVILLLAWALSAISVVPLGSRMVLNGDAAVRVLPAGAHLQLPWPFITRVLIEDGRIHETLLGELEAPLPVIGAQDEPTPAFDRRWDVAHPAESTFLVPAIATPGTGQGFRVIAGDVRVQWRIGQSDTDAILAVSRLSELDVVVARAARRALTRTCAAHPLATLMGGDRDRLGEELRAAVQIDVDQLAGGRSGLDVVAIVIDALHPPVGAAVAYQNVQAAEITALATVATARAAAAKSASVAAVAATVRLADAQAGAGEATALAMAEALRFDRERRSWANQRSALDTERSLAAFTRSFTGKPLILLDAHLDLRQVPGLTLLPFPVPGLGDATPSAAPSASIRVPPPANEHAP